MEKVSADTVTKLTIAFSPTAPTGPVPTTEQMIDELRALYKSRIQHLTRSIQNPVVMSAFTISRDKAVADLQKFEDIVKNVPNGFRLAPVWYSKVSQAENARTKEQYNSYVRPQFLRFLAEKHADELAVLGISPRGIERMKSGNNPVDANGKMYAVNVDHIIERAGGGRASLEKETDPDMPRGSKETYLVNHFNNFILLPTHVHELKNSLNNLQSTSYMTPGQSKWALMIVPEPSKPGFSGYVSRPQGHLPSQGRRSKLAVQNTTLLQLAAGAANQVYNVLDNPDQHDLLKPALDELAGTLKDAFATVSRPRQDIRSFRNFYEGEKFAQLREKIKDLPAAETEQMNRTLQSTDSSLKARFYKHAANNNKKKANSGGRRNHKPKRQRRGIRYHR